MKLAPFLSCAMTKAMWNIYNNAKVILGYSVVDFFALVVLVIYYSIWRNIFEKSYYWCWSSRWQVTDNHTFLCYSPIASKNDKDHLPLIHNITGEKDVAVVIGTTSSARILEIDYELTHPNREPIIVNDPRKKYNTSSLVYFNNL